MIYAHRCPLICCRSSALFVHLLSAVGLLLRFFFLLRYLLVVRGCTQITLLGFLALVYTVLMIHLRQFLRKLQLTVVYFTLLVSREYISYIIQPSFSACVSYLALSHA